MLQTSREHLVNALKDDNKIWDVLVVGGGATGLGIAVDAASRGYQTLLLEQLDFAQGTSSRSTKLVHGGVRYLAQGDIELVMEALYERGILLKNAPHLVKNQQFIIPNYEWWGGIFYGIGLWVYGLLAGKLSFGHVKMISKKQVIQNLPSIVQKGLYGGVVYHDGQFDDAKLAINLAQTSLEQGATVLNYFKVTGLLKDKDQQVCGVNSQDEETGLHYRIKSNAVINATGIFVDDLLQMDEPKKKPLVKTSQGAHIVLDKSFMPSDHALMVPKTDDGRVLFAVPWHGHLVVGTTDTPIESHSVEPIALETEIEFIINTIGKYLNKTPTRKDVLSVFAGQRPLAAPQDGSTKTKEISRSHKLFVSDSGLITITGGKWTTYRKMAEDTLNKVIGVKKMAPRKCKTQNLPIHGSIDNKDHTNHFYVYGSDLPFLHQLVEQNPKWNEPIFHGLPYLKGEIVWAIRFEMARKVEDVLARRFRILFLDARKAIDMAPTVAKIMAVELKKDRDWENEQVSSFVKLANGYLLEAYYP